jgi:uncharacterized protein YqjF (DUF2071 family)
VRRLADELKATFGGASLDGVTLSAIQRAAELGFIASDLRARRLRGEAVAVDEIVKAENAADRAVRRLGLGRKREPSGPTLSDYIAAHYSAETAEDASSDEQAEDDADGETRTGDVLAASEATAAEDIADERAE